MNPSDVPLWAQAGGLLAFALSVWWEQRTMRRALTEILVELRAQSVALGVKPARAASQPAATNTPE